MQTRHSPLTGEYQLWHHLKSVSGAGLKLRARIEDQLEPVTEQDASDAS